MSNQIQAKIIDGFAPFQYQQDTIIRCFDILNDVGGCFIMDSTGLGKTITALTLAINATNDARVLIVAPEKNKLAWLSVLNNCNNIQYVICGFKKINTQFDANIVIVDEAHNFRTTSTESYINLWSFIRRKAEMPKVILLSATPFQNTIEQFSAVCALIPFKTNTYAYLFLGDIFIKISRLQKEIESENKRMLSATNFSQIARSSNKIKLIQPKLDAYMQIVVEKLPEFCVKTTRTDITNLYPTDHKAIGSFPIIIEKNISIQISESTNELIANLIEKLQDNDKMPLARYNVGNYSNQSIKMIFNGIIKCLLLKRLDSSVHCFIRTIIGMIEKNNHLLNNMPNQSENGLFAINVNDEDSEQNELKFVNEDFFTDLQKDNKSLNDLLLLAKKCDNQIKFENLLQNINQNGKTIIFTEYVDSLQQIENYLQIHTNYRLISVDGCAEEETLTQIESDFDANHPKPTNNYDILICTDVMAEGINLHQATTIIHWDSKWNPQKTIQRNGRINRITKNSTGQKTIDIITLSMPELVDSLLQFNSKIEAKLSMAESIMNFNHRKYAANITANHNFKANNTYIFERTDRYKNNDQYMHIMLNDGMAHTSKFNFAVSNNHDIAYCNFKDVNGKNIISSKVNNDKSMLEMILIVCHNHNVETILHNHFSTQDKHIDYTQLHLIISNGFNKSVMNHFNRVLQKEFDNYKQEYNFHNIMESPTVQHILRILLNLMNFNVKSDVVYCEFQFE